ncbi:MAG: hypothetical protein IKA79_01100 [Lentisphaeria bacterium]|nr:hypothetical protein [Lentisphaeria bacterium]
MVSEKTERNRKGCRGQALLEYAAMLVMTTVVLVTLLFLLGAFTNYGARLINMVSWEPNPASYDAMASFGREN